VNIAAMKVRSGMEDLVVAGWSRVDVPRADGLDGGAYAMDPETAYGIGFVPQGIGADLIATLDGFSRRDVDTYAVESQTRAAKAVGERLFGPVGRPGPRPQRVDHPGARRARCAPAPRWTLSPACSRRSPVMGEAGGFDAVALQRYHWVERIDHVHHAGNSSGIVDGAALVLVGSEAAGAAAGLTPRARIVSVGLAGSDPTIMLTGPVPASRKALAKAGLTVGRHRPVRGERGLRRGARCGTCVRWVFPTRR
jgi:acetyl-CoA C-acetyltransferase